MFFFLLFSLPGEKNEEGRGGGEVWYTLRFFPQKDGKKD